MWGRTTRKDDDDDDELGWRARENRVRGPLHKKRNEKKRKERSLNQGKTYEERGREYTHSFLPLLFVLPSLLCPFLVSCIIIIPTLLNEEKIRFPLSNQRRQPHAHTTASGGTGGRQAWREPAPEIPKPPRLGDPVSFHINMHTQAFLHPFPCNF